MSEQNPTSEAVSLLQELGLQEYEARCFMALTQLSRGTAKDVHELSGVPRTRVYDALRVLESQGLVEVQHTSPQRYRSVGIDEATETLRNRYTSRIETLETHLEDAESREADPEDEELQEVWSLMGHDAIESRTHDLLEEADSEVALLVVDEDLLDDELFDQLRSAMDRNVTVVLGGLTQAIADRLRSELPAASVFETSLDWLVGEDDEPEVAISRIMLVDRETLLVGSFYPARGGETHEQAIFARGLENGMVVLIRRLLSSGLSGIHNPTQ
ncbi:TrmB family transcriptional regulator [Halostella sp. JP-L12]|uniref:TrmB family transcriptional regulator n=1 Tax=Halostella TaxID=1843185 RepID=UPI000EF7C629|nr:TrmB family transcriptional regulator [Halostella sp. JP-L12]